MENKPNRNSEKHKFDFKRKKENAINSLFEVEHFLCDFKKFVIQSAYIKY